MKYLAIDIETTGLNPELHDIIEIGAVLADSKERSPVDQLPKLNALVVTESGAYFTSPYCAVLHKDLWALLDKVDYNQTSNLTQEEPSFTQEIEGVLWDITIPQYIPDLLKAWLNSHGIDAEETAITLAGKNIQGFDLPFLKKEGYWEEFQISHRVLDPGSLFYRPEMDKIPSLDQILKMANIDKSVNHRAVADCYDVIHALEFAWDNAKCV